MSEALLFDVEPPSLLRAGRGDVRRAFGALLAEALVGPGSPAQAAYDYLVTDFAGQSPVVALASAGSEYPRASVRDATALHYLDVYLFVLRGEPGNAAYTEADADDALDSLAEAVFGLTETNNDAALWDEISYDGRSQIEPITDLGGNQYWMERITLRFWII